MTYGRMIMLAAVLLLAACSSIPGHAVDECRPNDANAAQDARCAGGAALDGVQLLDLVGLIGSIVP